jgi:isopentenyl phosphate kinase
LQPEAGSVTPSTTSAPDRRLVEPTARRPAGTTSAGSLRVLPPPTVVKVGGAVLTDKSSVRRLHTGRVGALARAIAMSWEHLRSRLVLVAGSGSFGHQTFLELGLHGGDRLSDHAFAARIDRHFDVYAALLVAGLKRHGVPASYVSLTGTRGDRPVALDALAAEAQRVRESGALPLLTGGIVADGDEFLAISSDRVTVRIAVACAAPHVVMVTDVPGVLRDRTDAGSVIPVIDAAAVGDIGSFITDGDVLDRTGGMREKLDSLAEAARAGVHGVVVSFDELRDFALLQRPSLLVGTHVPAVAAESAP